MFGSANLCELYNAGDLNFLWRLLQLLCTLVIPHIVSQYLALHCAETSADVVVKTL